LNQVLTGLIILCKNKTCVVQASGSSDRLLGGLVTPRLLPSMENLAAISEPKVPHNEQKD